nr:ubiquitin-conjugating enzyme family protein [Tanacetum cinerariifolium]
HFRYHVRDILMACKVYTEGVQVGSLMRGGVQNVDEGQQSCSYKFKTDVVSYIKRHSGGFPGDMSLGIGFFRRWGSLVRDSFPGDNPRRKGGSHVFFSQELSATVANFPRRHVVGEQVI